jgi:hypothetical protein
MTTLKVASFRWDMGAWQRNDIRTVNKSEFNKVNHSNGCMRYKRIGEKSLKFPSKPKTKPKRCR